MNDIRFTRREVNAGLLTTAIALAASGRMLARGRGTVLFDFAIAGGYYHGLAKAAGLIARGETLLLRAEPANPYDSNAVAVHRADGTMLGYIPRAANAPVARLLAGGARIDAEVVGRFDFRRAADIPDDFAFTSVGDGDPRIRLTLRG